LLRSNDEFSSLVRDDRYVRGGLDGEPVGAVMPQQLSTPLAILLMRNGGLGNIAIRQYR
jgi:hypothetical protein